MATPTISYASWCELLRKAGARHGGTIEYGPDTYDAWARGMSADAYAKARKGR